MGLCANTFMTKKEVGKKEIKKKRKIKTKEVEAEKEKNQRRSAEKATGHRQVTQA